MKPTRIPTKYEGITKLEWPNGRTTYRATAPWWIDSEGKRNDPTKHADTLTDARAWRNEQLALRARGVKQPTGRLSIGEYLDDWIAAYEARKPGNTAAGYRRALAKLRELPLWKVKLADVEPHHVARAYDTVGARAVPYVHDALHRALNDAVPRLIGRNPATGAARGRAVARAERSVWTEDEYRTWLAAAAEDELWPLWRFLGQSGARRGEALGLDWPDVDLDAGTVTIRRQYTVVAGRATLKDVKTARGRRTVDLDAETVAVLRDWRKRQPRALHPAAEHAFAVFTYPDGARVGPTRSLNDRFQAVVTAAKVRRLTIHDVRHTHATLLLRRGVPVHVVSRRLGHASEAITLTVYAHVLPDQARVAADVAGAIAEKAARPVGMNREEG